MKRRSGFLVMARLIGLVKPLAGFMALAIIMGLAGHLAAAFITIFGGYAVLNLLGFGAVPALGTIFACVLCFALFRGLLRYAEQACNHYIAFKLLALIRDKVFRALRRLCPAKLEGRDKGDLISIITSDIELLEVFYAHTISPAAIAFLFTVILCLFIGSFHPVLGFLALLAYIVVGIAIPLITSRLSGGDGMEFRGKSGELSSFVLDSLRGLPEMIQYGQGEARLAEMDARTDALSVTEKRMKHVSGRNMAATNVMILVFDLAMLFVSAKLYQSGNVDFCGVIIPTLALFSSFGPTIALANLGSTLQNTFAAGNRVLDILEEVPVAEEITKGVSVGFSGAELENVTFSYGTVLGGRSLECKKMENQDADGKNLDGKVLGGKGVFADNSDEASSLENGKILDHFSLTIPPNKIMGISGKSGSGKSTLLKLLMRFWKTDGGEIRISGESIERINTAALREMESFVTQETHLFHDSIRNNLRIAKLDATDAQMQAACQKASVHDFIMSLPQGYDTPVGELGDTLSGGERQRLGLARAFLHGAPFLLLDEPTSNLDSLNEAVILKSLKQEREGRTVVLVSHRMSTMRIADAELKIGG